VKTRFVDYLTCFIILLLSCSLYPAWFDSLPGQLTQPDGTEIEVLYTGDEHHFRIHDKDDFTMLRDSKTGYLCWAVTRDGDLVSTGRPVHLFTPQSLGISPRQDISDELYRQKRRLIDDSLRASPTRTPTTGVINELVIFVRFSDDDEFDQPVSYYDQMLNASGAGVNSLKQYYTEASYYQLTVNSHLFPLQTQNTVISYQDPNPRGYFQQYNEETNPIGYILGDDRTNREHHLLGRVAAYVSDFIPISLNIDTDNDNCIDNVNFILKGDSTGWSTLLWPHRWVLYTANYYIHNKRIWDYNLNIETHITNSGVSVLAHEFGHTLGAPDYYRRNYDANPVGSWDIMAYNSTPPQSMSAYTKWHYMHWVPAPPIVTWSGYQTLYPNTTTPNQHALMILSPYSDTEYIILEYRDTNTGLIDSALPGSGLVIWRINTLAPEGEGNINGPPDELYVYRQNGTLDSDGNVNMAYFSLASDMTYINQESDPYPFLSNGAYSGLDIYDICVEDMSVTFYVRIPDADPNDIDESFETGNFNALDWTNDPTSPWSVINTPSIDGYHCATVANIGDNHSSQLETTLNLSSGFFHFYVRTSTEENSDFLRFYLNGELIESWSGNTNWIFYPMFVTSGIKNLRWVYEKDGSGRSGQDRVWIDAIGFPQIAGPNLYPPRNLSLSSDERDIHLQWTAPYTTNMANPPTLIGYNVYKNNILLNTIPTQNTTYDFYTTGGEDCQYWSIAVYSEGISQRSNVVNHSMPFATATNLQAVLYEDTVRLNWTYNYPLDFVTGFRVLRNGTLINQPYADGHIFTYLDTTLPTSGLYVYTVAVQYFSPAGESLPTNEVSIQYLNQDDQNLSPTYTQLKYNYPNPFNPETQIHFSLAKDTNVRLEIYNIKGELVKNLINQQLPSGQHHTVWNGTNSTNQAVSSGVYFYKMDTPEYSSVKKMILLK